MAAMFASPQDALTTPARPTCGRVDLINGASRSVPLNPPEMSANEPNFAPGVLPRYVRISRDFAAFGPRCGTACHAEGRGFEPLQPLSQKPRSVGVFYGPMLLESVGRTRRYHSALPTRGYACDTREQATFADGGG